MTANTMETIIILVLISVLAISNIIRDFIAYKERKDLCNRIMSENYTEYNKYNSEKSTDNESALTRRHKAAIDKFHSKGMGVK